MLVGLLVGSDVLVLVVFVLLAVPLLEFTITSLNILNLANFEVF